MDTVLERLRRANVIAGLFFGTLLGAIRTGDFIPWDSDADLLVTEDVWDEACAALSAMDEAGYVVAVEADRITVRAAASNVDVDIFRGRLRVDGRWEVRGWVPFMWSGRWSECSFRGRPYLAPRDPCVVLRCLYGAGWQVPFSDHWSSLYASSAAPQEPSAFAVHVADELAPGNGKRVLDVGCGNGRDSIHFAAHGFEVVGYDPTVEAIEAAERLVSSHTLSQRPTFLVTDSMVDAPATNIDIVYMRFVLHAIQKVTSERVVSAVSKTLRRGGRIFVEVRSDPGGPLAMPLYDGGYLVDGHYRRPFSRGEIHGLLVFSGFGDVHVTPSHSIRGDDVAATWRVAGSRL